MEPDILNENQKYMIKQLYESYFNDDFSLNAHTWVDELEIPQNEVFESVEDLISMNFCKFVAMGGACQITPYGIVRSEELGLIDEGIMGKNTEKRSKIIEEIFHQSQGKPRNDVYAYEICEELNIDERDFYLHYAILKYFGYLEHGGYADLVKITQFGKKEVQKVLEKREILEEFKEIEKEAPHKRGRDFDPYIAKILSLQGWETESKVIGKGEEIDVFIMKNDSIYLFECKWEKDPCQPKYISEFHGLLSKRNSVDGIFISMSGYTDNAIESVGEFKDTRTIYLFGNQDIEDIITDKITFEDSLSLKKKAFVLTRKIIVDGKEY